MTTGGPGGTCWATFDAAVGAFSGARVVDQPGEFVEFFGDARGVHAYGLADTEEPFWSASRWYREGDAVVGLVGMIDAPLTVYAVSTRDVTGSTAMVVRLAQELRAGVLFTGPVGMSDAVAAGRRVAWSGLHVRYELVDPDVARAAADLSVEGLTWLGASDRLEVRALYDSDPGAAFFSVAMLDHDTFVGVRREGRLMAIAGTHVVSDRLGVAAIGAVYVTPSMRGRGLGRAVTAAVVTRLLDRLGQQSTIALNVSATNAAARAVYASLGFVPVLDYDEIELA